jgi:hypothetical protein
MRQDFLTKVNIPIIGILFLFGCNTQIEQFSLTEQNHEMWRDYIKPTERDLSCSTSSTIVTLVCHLLKDNGIWIFTTLQAPYFIGCRDELFCDVYNSRV